MKFRKFIPVALSCLFLLETPFTSMAASVPLTESNAAVSDAGMEISSGNMQAQKAAGKQTSLKLKTESLTIFTENTYQLKLSGSAASNAVWKSSAPKVATVDENGLITGVAPGTATIIASASKAKVFCTVTVLQDPHKLNRETQVLLQGDSATVYLSNVSNGDSVSFKLADPSSEVIDISTSGNKCKIKAEKPGTVTLNALCTSEENDQKVTSKRTCTIKVIEKGIAQQQVAMAVKTKKAFHLENIKEPDLKVTNTVWASSQPKVASVNPASGVVTGKHAGLAEITATVTYSNGTSATFPTTVRVSDPKIKPNRTVLSTGQQRKLKVTGTTPFSTVKWKVKKTSVATIQEDGTVTAGANAGRTTITAEVDGTTIRHQLIVTKPQLASVSTTLATGKKHKVPLKGVSSGSKITYRSKKPSIAKVNKSGTVIGRSSGTTDIIVKADGLTFTYKVTVISQRALKACKTGYSIISSSSYSQARRMTPGYYDCSSLVFRAYGCDSGLLGGTPSWAPTAASMAAYLEGAGKAIAYGPVDVSKLMPGDLIFYRLRRGGNGRYRNIYHVSMYYGDGYRLEKPLRAYRPEGHITMIARPTKN